MAPSAAPVLVVGSGPSGLVAALVLLQNGVPVRIIDKAPSYPIGQRANGLWPRTFEAFHFLHVPEIHQRASPVLPMREYKPGTLEVTNTYRIIEHNDPTPPIPYSNAMLLGQPVVESILRSHLEKHGCSVELGTELVSFEDDGERVLAKLVKRKDGEEIAETFEASYLIGADGAKGVTRKQMGLTFLGETKDNMSAVVGDVRVEVEGIDRKHWHNFGDRSTDILNFRPTDDIAHDGFQIMLISKDYDPKQLIADQKLMFELMSKLIGREIKVRKVIFFSEFRPNIRMANQFGVGRVFVAGDAAHVHSPTGGQGLNTSVQDAINLSWKMSLVYKGLSPATLLDSYTAERLPVVAEMLNLTTQILERVTKGPTRQGWMRRDQRLNMLGVNCRASPVVLDEYTVRAEGEEPVSAYGVLEEGVLVAGDRAPDAPGLVRVVDVQADASTVGQGEDKRETRLFDVFGTSYHTVLMFTVDASMTRDVLAALRRYTPVAAGADAVVRPLVVLPRGSEATGIVLGQQAGEDIAAVVVDSEGHAYRAYLAEEGGMRVVVVRPDGVVGAIVHGTEGAHCSLLSASMSAYGTTRNHHGGSSAFSSTTSASITLFRRLSWEGTVPLEIRVDPKELPANSDRGLECYYVQAPRVSYLPLLMPEIRRFLMDIVFDEAAGKMLKEEDWWFESEEGTLLKWHWPIGLIYDNHTISASIRPNAPPMTSSGSNLPATPLKLILHLASPPTEKLLLPPTAESCKQAFMGQLKEADFIRWGNTKRMTGLRKAEQDGIWEGIKEHNFDDYWRVASKIVPTTAPTRPSSPPPPSGGGSLHARPATTDQQSAPDRDGAYNVRSVPVRLYLPDGPVIQDLVPPSLDDGTSHTLSHYLSTHLPLLFPPQQALTGPELAYALIQGIVAPSETEMGWLGACLAGADGWVNICVGISR